MSPSPGGYPYDCPDGPASKDIGRCSVFNPGKAVFSDLEFGTRLCQQCYDREARAAGLADGDARAAGQ